MLKDRSVLKNCFIELFAGCGGNVLGLMQAGWKCLAAVERAEDAVWTLWTNLAMTGFTSLKASPEQYEKLKNKIGDRWQTHNNFFTHIPGNDWLSQKDEISPIMGIWCSDMTVLEPEELMESIGIQPGEIGLISGGPPCQGFSTANDGRHMEDHRNQLPFRYIYFVKRIQPHVFEMENVPGMLSLGKKKGETEGPFMKWIRTAADEAGYHFEYHILNAMHYGVPQSRRRVIMLGIRKDLYEAGARYSPPPITHNWSFYDALENGTAMEHIATGKQPYVTVREAIGDLSMMHLSSSRDQDCKHLPDGHRNRRGNGSRSKNKDDITLEIRDDNHVWYKDRFSGNWFKGNHMADHGEKDFDYIKSCRYCGKMNILIRPNCHYCHKELLPLPNFDYLLKE